MPVIEIASGLVCDSTSMACCFMCQGGVVLKMSTSRWPRSEQSAPFDFRLVVDTRAFVGPV